MIPYLLDHNTGFSNYIKFFGFAELPENIPINASKTVTLLSYSGLYLHYHVGEDVLQTEVRRLKFQRKVELFPNAQPTPAPSTEALVLRR